MPAPGAAPTIADLVEVTPAETVVRLDGTRGRLPELVLTGDVVRSLAAVLEAAQGPTGGAFLVVGHFGSGKSHFLAALGELLADPDAARSLAGWDARVRELAITARPSLVVAAPLVEHRADAALEEVVWQRAWRALERVAPPLGTDRAEGWGSLLAAARSAGRDGLLFLVDELSEFLKAKRGPALTEDLRFLQFLGEWPREAPVLVVGALQESLEEVASVSQRELARIRDRYPITLGLSMRHVRDLVRGRLVRLRPGAAQEVERIHRELQTAFPGWAVTRDALVACYPLHPDTLTVLDGLRFLLSQQRGAVDFICRRLRGDGAAGIAPWLPHDARDLLTPDRIYDHFRTRLHERVETNRLADTVVPYYERSLTAVLDAEDDRDLALRAVKLLTLLAASALERRRTGRELAEMLLTRVSALDPRANHAYLERAVLEPLVAHGAYIVGRGTDAAVTYSVELDADAPLTARTRIQQLRAELAADDRRPVEALVEAGSSATLELGLLRRTGRTRRDVVWQNTLRPIVVTSGRLADLAARDVADLERAIDATGAEIGIVIAEPEIRGGAASPPALAEQLAEEGDRLAFWIPDALTDEEADFAFDLFCRRVLLAQAREEGRLEAGGLVEYLQRSGEGDPARAREALHRCYFSGTLVSAAAGGAAELPSLSGLPFERVLRSIAAPVLHGLHPRHQEVQPLAELVGERLLREVVTEALAAPRVTIAAAGRTHLRHLIDSYLVPLGAMRRRGDAFVVAPDPARSPAVAELLRLVGARPRVPAAEVVEALGRGSFGLTVPEALILLNAAVQAGLVQAHRRGREPGEPFLSMAEAGSLSLGELVPADVRARVPELAGVLGPGPHEPWNAHVQQSAWEYARAWLQARAEEIAEVRRGVETLAASPAFAEADLGPIRSDLDAVGAVVAAADPSAGPREGLEAFLGSVQDTSALLAAAGRTGALARFLRIELRAFEAAVDYAASPELTIPDDPEHARLIALRGEALAAAGQALALAADDRARESTSALERFRLAYTAAYEESHRAFYAAGGDDAQRAVRTSPAYRALAALSELGAAAVPDDRVKVDRALAAAAVEPCRRRVEAELAWRPLCGCGHRLGDRPPALDVARLVAVAGRGVVQHLEELGGEDSRRRVQRAADDLRSLDRTEAADDLESLLRAATDPAAADPGVVAGLLGSELRSTLREVLSGRQLVVARDLAQLREDLIGRRYPRHRLLELVGAWVDGDGAEPVPDRAFVEVVDSGDAGSGAPAAPAAASSTAALLRTRWPHLASLLPAHRPDDAFWLAAWWHGRPSPPDWVPPGLVADADVRAAAAAVAEDPSGREELAVVDARVGPRTLLGDQVEGALGLARADGAGVLGALFGERLLRHPVRLASAAMLQRLGADVQLVEKVPAGALGRLAAEHPLLDAAGLRPLELLFEAAGCLARLERRLAGADCAELVHEVYPECLAPVADLLSRAQLALAAAPVVDAAAIAPLAAAAARLRQAADAVLRDAAAGGFDGCLRLWDVGETVIAPLLREHGRVAVLVVDAMRADLWLRCRALLWDALPGRRLTERWAVVPPPTRTAEAMAALFRGRPVAEGSLAADEPVSPFPGLGVQAALLPRADRDASWPALRELWSGGPPVSVAVATGVDERLHHTPVELAELLEECVTALGRRVAPSLQSLPAGVPLVVLADHGFRENPAWGRDGRYAHGGLSVEEAVVPVAVFGRAEPAGRG